MYLSEKGLSSEGDLVRVLECLNIRIESRNLLGGPIRVVGAVCGIVQRRGEVLSID